MKFLMDHDVPVEIGRVLRRRGCEVYEVKEVLSSTASDEQVFSYAKSHNMLLITCNRDDFVPLATSNTHAGLIVLVRRRSRIEECASLISLLKKAGEKGLKNNINFA